MVGWALLLDYIFLPMINYLVIGIYMQRLLPVGTPQAMWIVGCGGPRDRAEHPRHPPAGQHEPLFVASQFVFIAVFAVAAIVQDHRRRRRRVLTRAVLRLGDRHYGLVFAGAAILACRSSASTPSRTLSEETQNPRQKIPLAIMLCTVVGGLVTFIPVPTSAHLAFPDYTSFANAGRPPRADVMKLIGEDFLNSFFTAAYVAGAFACAMASPGDRLAHPVRDGPRRQPAHVVLLPAAPEYRTPVTAQSWSSASSA